MNWSNIFRDERSLPFLQQHIKDQQAFVMSCERFILLMRKGINSGAWDEKLLSSSAQIQTGYTTENELACEALMNAVDAKHRTLIEIDRLRVLQQTIERKL